MFTNPHLPSGNGNTSATINAASLLHQEADSEVNTQMMLVYLETPPLEAEERLEDFIKGTILTIEILLQK